ncbi:hypothetical protein NHX12_020841, partial [Muraenolepis orangiensis]
SPTRIGEQGQVEDGSAPLPVVMEEEEGSSQTVSVTMAGSDSSAAKNGSPNAVTGPGQDQLRSTVAEDPSRACEKDETSVVSKGTDALKEDRNSQLPSDKEVEAEFQKLSLGLKCDLFTLDKRLRLEERSRDLAEENALTPLCEDDNQSMEIIHRLQKNLEILIQSMTRVSSRSEMLGAIHQENRIGKAVEVMIQHVENLKRMYAKEHAELLELKQTLLQNERSFGSQTDKADYRGKPPSSQYYKTKAMDLVEGEVERLTRRSPWSVPGRGGSRPPLKRFISSGAWVDGPGDSGGATDG